MEAIIVLFNRKQTSLAMKEKTRNINRETEAIKNNHMEILKLKNVISEIKRKKKTLEWLNRRMEVKETDTEFEIVCQLE